MSRSRSLFEDEFLHSADVCSNCFGVRLVAPEPAQPEACKRNRETTTVEHVPGDRPADDVELFCECGVSDADTRIWRIDDVDDRRFKTLLKRSIYTAEHKGLPLDRRRTIRVALARWRRDWSVNRAIGTGLSAGLVDDGEPPAPAD